jgi:hypothetical protein
VDSIGRYGAAYAREIERREFAVPNGIGNKATLPPTATNSPPPQVKLVLAVSPGAVTQVLKHGYFVSIEQRLVVIV